MKKLSLVIMCAAALVLVSCGGNSNKKGNGKAAETKTSVADAVDLGLSVKWAKTNLGAKDASEPGNYYAWAGSGDRTRVRFRQSIKLWQ